LTCNKIIPGTSHLTHSDMKQMFTKKNELYVKKHCLYSTELLNHYNFHWYIFLWSNGERMGRISPLQGNLLLFIVVVCCQQTRSLQNVTQGRRL